MKRLIFLLVFVSLGISQTGEPRFCLDDPNMDHATGCVLKATAEFVIDLDKLKDCRVNAALDRYQKKVLGQGVGGAKCEDH